MEEGGRQTVGWGGDEEGDGGWGGGGEMTLGLCVESRM